MADMGRSELEILALLRAKLPGGAALTDDCGAIPPPGPGAILLVTTDLMEEGTHFRREWHPPRFLGRKLAAVNLSDLDASGARPVGVTLTLALPPGLEEGWLDEFLSGLAESLGEAGVPVLGGDTVGRATGVGLGLTAFGHAVRWLRRDGVRPGDGVFVDQELGASLRGLRKLQAGQRWDPAAPDPDLAAHLDPRPRLGLGPRLAAITEVHACLDLSDGLSRDLRNLAQASAVSFELAEDLQEDALRGGEDYARCFASSLSREELETHLGRSLRQVARAIPQGPSPVLRRQAGGWAPVEDLSHRHF